MDVYEVASAIAATVLPPFGIFKAGADILVRKRVEEGQRLLISEIASRGLGGLSQEKWDYFVPAAYRFFEQVRLGEYDHNLRVLAKLLAGGLLAEGDEADIGKVGRAAKKLEMLPKPHLVALSRCPRAFDIYAASSESDGYWVCINAPELRESFAEVGVIVSPVNCQEWLHELASRGILTVGGRPSRVGGTFYYKNSAYNEVISAAEAVAHGSSKS